MEFRNPIFTENGLIDCQIKHLKYGWIPFTCAPNDTGAKFDTSELFFRMSLVATSYTAPTISDQMIEWREKAFLSRLDFCTSLVRLNILTKDQALATIDGVWPEPMLSFLSFLDADQAFEVQMEWKAAVTVQRNHPFILSLGSWLELTTAQLDAMFGWVVA
jgi:hypothetical protein